MSTYAYHKVREQIQHLTTDEKIQLMQDVLASLRHQVTQQPLHSVMEFKGLGKEIWEGIDVQKYIDEERDSWGG